MTDGSSAPHVPAAAAHAGDDAADVPATVVDALGLHCPMPVIELARAVEAAPLGALVEVWSDDPSSRVDIPVWARLRGHVLAGTRELDGGGQAYVVRRVV